MNNTMKWKIACMQTFFLQCRFQYNCIFYWKGDFRIAIGDANPFLPGLACLSVIESLSFQFMLAGVSHLKGGPVLHLPC